MLACAFVIALFEHNSTRIQPKPGEVWVYNLNANNRDPFEMPAWQTNTVIKVRKGYVLHKRSCIGPVSGNLLEFEDSSSLDLWSYCKAKKISK